MRSLTSTTFILGGALVPYTDDYPWLWVPVVLLFVFGHTMMQSHWSPVAIDRGED